MTLNAVSAEERLKAEVLDELDAVGELLLANAVDEQTADELEMCVCGYVESCRRAAEAGAAEAVDARGEADFIRMERVLRLNIKAEAADKACMYIRRIVAKNAAKAILDAAYAAAEADDERGAGE